MYKLSLQPVHHDGTSAAGKDQEISNHSKLLDLGVQMGCQLQQYPFL